MLIIIRGPLKSRRKFADNYKEALKSGRLFANNYKRAHEIYEEIL